MKELEMLADAIEAEATEGAEEGPTLEGLVSKLTDISTQLAELVGAMKAAEPESVEEEDEETVEEKETVETEEEAEEDE